MAGIREVAKEAGVSISTVSYALNGSSKISEKTRMKIQSVAEMIGYTPKLAARTLKGSKTNIIGVYISGFQGEFYGELLDGIQHQLEKLGYDMMVNSGGRTHKFLSEKLFDGAIVLDYKYQTKELYEVLEKGNKIVVLDREIQHQNARTVLLNNQLGSQQAISYLTKKNCQKYFIIAGPLDNYDVQTRLLGVKKAFEKAGLPYEVCAGDFTQKSGLEAADYIVNQAIEGKVGIYSLNDDQAIGFYRYALQNNILIDEKYVLVGFDNNHSADFLAPVLPSISYKKHLWGEVAAKTVVDLIEKTDLSEIKDQIIPTQLSFRDK